MCAIYLASFPGHSQILSHSCGEKSDFSPWLQDKIWEWPGRLGTRLPSTGSLGYCLHTAPTQGSLEQTLSPLLSVSTWPDIVAKQREAELVKQRVLKPRTKYSCEVHKMSVFPICHNLHMPCNLPSVGVATY